MRFLKARFDPGVPNARRSAPTEAPSCSFSAIAIEWILMPKQMSFGSPWELKKLVSADMFVRNLYDTANNGVVQFDIQYRPDDYPCPIDWCDFTECLTVQNSDDDPCVALSNRHPQYRTALTFPQPEDECNTITNRNMRSGFKFQPIIKTRGAAEINRIRVKAETTVDPKDTACGNAACKTLECCPINPIEYSSEEDLIT